MIPKKWLHSNHTRFVERK